MLFIVRHFGTTIDSPSHLVTVTHFMVISPTKRKATPAQFECEQIEMLLLFLKLKSISLCGISNNHQHGAVTKV